MNLPSTSSPPPSEFVVVGEHRADPSQLLLLGADGRYYAYAPTDGQPTHVEVDEAWDVENSAVDAGFD